MKVKTNKGNTKTNKGMHCILEELKNEFLFILGSFTILKIIENYNQNIIINNRIIFFYYCFRYRHDEP